MCYVVRLQQEKGRALPKFGEWDVNDPASADGFTVIFAKARDEKNSNPTAATQPMKNGASQSDQGHDYPPKVFPFSFFFFQITYVIIYIYIYL